MIRTVRDTIAQRVIGVGLALVAVAIVGSTTPHHLPTVAKPPWHPPSVTASPTKPSSPKPRHITRQKVHPSPDQRDRSNPDGSVSVAFDKPVLTDRRPSSPSYQPTTRPTSSPTRYVRCTVGARVLRISACLRL